MKYLSFITLFIYLALLIPSSELPSLNSRADVTSSITPITLAAKASTTHPAIYIADSSDDDDAAILWNTTEPPYLRAGKICVGVFFVCYKHPQYFLARAPPADIN